MYNLHCIMYNQYRHFRMRLWPYLSQGDTCMIFKEIANYSFHPEVVYDGTETAGVQYTVCDGKDIDILIQLGKEETWAWRHYYKDEELNELADTFRFSYRFILGTESAINSAINSRIFLQPSYINGIEYTICFSFDELSYGHYVYWVIGTAKRVMEASEHSRRVEEIKKYWTSNK
jgi:hypothetical protein